LDENGSIKKSIRLKFTQVLADILHLKKPTMPIEKALLIQE